MKTNVAPDLWALVSALLLLALMAGCDSKQESPTDSLEISSVEPTTVDESDQEAIDRFQSSQEQIAIDQRAASWPQLFGADRTSVAPSQPVNLNWGSQAPPEKWSIAIGTGYGSPVVHDESVVFNHRIDDEEIVQCVSAVDGSSIWTHKYSTTFQGDSEYSNGPYSTPLIHQGRVYSYGGQGRLFCLGLQNGDVIWERKLHEEFEVEPEMFPAGATPIIVANKLILNVGGLSDDSGIVALNIEDGKTVWSANNQKAGYCSPIATTIDGQDYLFVYTNESLVSLHPDTGAVDWVVDHYGRAPMSYNAVSPLVSGNKVLVVTGPGPGALCLKIYQDRTQEELWKNRRVLDSQYNTLMLHQDKVIGFTAGGQGGAEMRCIDFKTGDLVWKYHSVLRRGQALMVDGAIIALGERGHLAALLTRDDGVDVLSFTSNPVMSEPCYCAPALANSHLFLKDEERIACFDLTVQ